uniref:Ty3/gypsy retrotransposon protein n=1 Tax=Tanacetum cinerariifolium TaxID=118510 RepID=A0A6L2LSG7_TANCI|nr:Ty3/gypsy retrotransposon protein [Tanacetum cinerariifolium]
MVRDNVQLETAVNTVNTITHEYLLEFTSEYGISEALRPELPRPGDRIVDFSEGKVGVYTRVLSDTHIPAVSYRRRQGWMSFSKRPGKNTPQCYTKPLDSLKNWNNRFFWVDECVFPTAVEWRKNASKDGIPASGTYSVEAVRVLDTHCTPIQKQPEALLCLVGISRRHYLGDDVYLTFHYDDDRGGDGSIRLDSCSQSNKGEDRHELPLLTLTASRVIEIDEPAVATDSSGVPSAIEKSPLDFADEAEASGKEPAAPEMPPPEEVPLATAPGAGQAVEAGGGKSLAAMHLCLDSNVFMSEGVPDDVSDPDPLAFAGALSNPPVDLAQSSLGVAVAEDPGSENASLPIEVLSPGGVYRPEWGVTNGSLLDTPEACQDLVDHAAPPGYFAELCHMPNDEFLRQYNVNLARQVAMGSQLRLRGHKKWRQYLLRRKFRVFMDQHSLKHLLTQHVQTHQHKWITKLLWYDFEIHYKPGKDNRVADALSHVDTPISLAISTPTTTWLHALRKYFVKDLVDKTVWKKISDQPQQNVTYTLSDGLIYVGNRLFIPDEPAIRTCLLLEFHSFPLEGHSGIKATVKRLG